MSGADQGHHDHATALHDDAPESHHEDGHGGGHDDGHGHDAEPLGPIDVKAWGAGILGVASGLLVAGVMFLAINPS
jgi:hypothetical protein